MTIMVSDKTALQKEIFHRVSNNFQIIQSMIRLVSRDKTISNHSQELEERIQLLSIAHHSLHSSDATIFHGIRDALPNLVVGIHQGGFLLGREISCNIEHDIVSVQRTYAVLHVVIEVLRALERTTATKIDVSLTKERLTIASDTEDLVANDTAKMLAAAFARDFGNAPTWTSNGLSVPFKPV